LGAVHLIYTAEPVFPAAFENILFKPVHLRFNKRAGKRRAGCQRIGAGR